MNKKFFLLLTVLIILTTWSYSQTQISSAGISFTTPNGDNKDHDTEIMITVKDANYYVVGTVDYTDDIEFEDNGSVHFVPINIDPKYNLGGIGISHVYVTIRPHGGAGHDTWYFQASLIYHLSNGQTLNEPLKIENTNNIIAKVDQDYPSANLVSY